MFVCFDVNVLFGTFSWCIDVWLCADGRVLSMPKYTGGFHCSVIKHMSSGPLISVTSGILCNIKRALQKFGAYMHALNPATLMQPVCVGHTK